VIGLSVSCCIADILQGRIDEADVEFIVGGTKCERPEHWDDVIEAYREQYWHKDPARGEVILRRLVEEERIIQPRVAGRKPPRIGRGHWTRRGSLRIAPGKVC